MLVRHSIALSVAATIGIAYPLSDPELTGRWNSATVAAGTTMSVTLDLYKNGMYAQRIVAVSELGWSVSGDTLMVAPVISRVENGVTYGKSSAVPVKIIGDQMVQSAGKETLTFKRVTWPVVDAPVLGRWESQSDSNEELAHTFTADGRLIVSVTVSREAGRWMAISDEEIRWETQIPESGRKKTRYKLQNGKLILYIARALTPIEMTKELPTN